MKRKISVVIPVYNTCNYLKDCLESVLQQSYSDMEVILVDDGSADGSGEICDRYADKDSRIRVIHQANKGVVAARKQGVKMAKGEYIAFIDSDDYIGSGMLEKLEGIAEEFEADLVTSGCIREYAGKQSKTQMGSVPLYDGFPEGLYDIGKKRWICENLVCFEHYSEQGMLPYLCTKLFRKELLENNIDRIPESITFSEDSCLVYMCCMDAERIYVLHDAYYHYYMREDSCVHTPEKNCFGVLNECYHCLDRKVKESAYQDVLSQQVERFIAMITVSCLNNRFGFSDGGVLPLYITSPGGGWSEGTKIVLYGAGKVGCSCYRQIMAMGQADIVLWVDGDDKVVQGSRLLKPVSSILKEEYDYILIAVKRKGLADIISRNLQKMGIEREKIVWKEPQYILDIYH